MIIQNQMKAVEKTYTEKLGTINFYNFLFNFVNYSLKIIHFLLLFVLILMFLLLCKSVELYSDVYINGDKFKNIEADALVIENAYKKAKSLAVYINFDSRRQLFGSIVLQKMEKGDLFASTLNASFANKLSLKDETNLEIVLDLIDSIETDDTITLAFKDDLPSQIFRKEIVMKPNFIFERGSKNFYDTNSNGTLVNEIIIPLNNGKYNAVNCVNHDQLPKFYQRYLN